MCSGKDDYHRYTQVCQYDTITASGGSKEAWHNHGLWRLKEAWHNHGRWRLERSMEQSGPLEAQKKHGTITFSGGSKEAWHNHGLWRPKRSMAQSRPLEAHNVGKSDLWIHHRQTRGQGDIVKTPRRGWGGGRREERGKKRGIRRWCDGG